MTSPLLEADGLTKTYPSREGRSVHKAVDSVSLTLAAGETLGIVGESGSGKSTLARLLLRLIEPTAGTVRFMGDDLMSLPPDRLRARRRDMQIVFQDPYASLHPRHTVDRALAEPLAIHGMGAEADRRIERLLVEVGLGPSFRYRFPHQLSGGQRQRVAIARALILEPEILLLDEPTSALDVSVQAEILNLLQRLRRERRLTFVLVSHNLAVVAHMCDRLAVMNRGRIVEEMTVAQLRAAAPREAYTRQLLAASLGYSRQAAAEMRDYD